MPFTKPSDDELQSITDRLLAHFRQLDHPLQQPQRLTLRQMEQTANAIAQRLATQITADALAEHTQQLGTHATCPQCQHAWTIETRPRPIATPTGTLHYDEPVAHCPACRRDFFPSASSTRTDRSPA